MGMPNNATLVAACLILTDRVSAVPSPSENSLANDRGSWQKGLKFSKACKPEGLIPVEIINDARNIQSNGK